MHHEYKEKYKIIIDNFIIQNTYRNINYNFLLYNKESFNQYKYYKNKYPNYDITFNIVMPFKDNVTFFDNDFIDKNKEIKWLNDLDEKDLEFLKNQNRIWDNFGENIIEYKKYFHETEKIKNKSCYLNVNYLDISFDGFILKCANDLYMEPKSKNKIVNFTETELLQIAKSSNTCKWDYCNLFCRFQKDEI
jgi:hypothetical protein